MTNAVDPLLHGKQWESLRRYWLRLRVPNCARCGRPIDYARTGGDPRWYFELGHIVSRVDAKHYGWSDARINCIANTQPEHRWCNRSAGGKHRLRPYRKRRRPIESADW